MVFLKTAPYKCSLLSLMESSFNQKANNNSPTVQSIFLCYLSPPPPFPVFSGPNGSYVFAVVINDNIQPDDVRFGEGSQWKNKGRTRQFRWELRRRRRERATLSFECPMRWAMILWVSTTNIERNIKEQNGNHWTNSLYLSPLSWSWCSGQGISRPSYNYRLVDSTSSPSAPSGRVVFFFCCWRFILSELYFYRFSLGPAFVT